MKDEILTAIALIITSIVGTIFTKDGNLLVMCLPIGILLLAMCIADRKERKRK